MGLKFGTDGIRGRAHDELSVADVERLAEAAGVVLGGEAIVIGRDTRESGPAFVRALCRGFAHDGIESWDLGVAPTPAVAHVAAEHGIAGVMVSASHNPYHDNGIKFFAPGGRKLTDTQQHDMEAELAKSDQRQLGDAVAVDRADLVQDYAEWVASTVAADALAGLHIVADCAHGAASVVAPRALRQLGARVDVIHDRPDGRNINDGCGSTDMTALRSTVIHAGADVGIAFDGDADRMLAVDEAGRDIDGDQIIGVCAVDRHNRGVLVDDTVVVTVMTNLGFHQGMSNRNIAVHETPVGDRHVLEALQQHHWSLGGEQSGHVIFHDLATTGDGLLTAVQLLDVVVRSGKGLGPLAAATMDRLPQRLRNAEVAGTAAQVMELITDDIARVQAQLGDTGRLLVRPSGTEPLIRVMAEAPTQELADAAVEDLIDVLGRLGAS